MANTIYIKRGTFATLPTLGNSGKPEIGLSTDTQQFFVGDGTSNYEVLLHKKFNATTFLYATNDNTPEPKTRAEVLGILSGQASVDFSMNSKKITNLAQCTAANDAANKAYVDALVTSGINWMEAVKDKDTLTPPSSPTTGDRYWIGGAGTDDWYGHDYDVTEWDGSAWQFTEVTEGDTAYVDDENLFYFYDGSTLKLFSTGMGSHHTTHENGGSDEISVAGLSGLLADAQTPLSHKDTHDPVDGADKLDTAAAIEIAGVQSAGIGSSHSFARADHVHAISHGITDNHIVTIDSSSVASLDYAKFTAYGLEGRSYSEVKADLGLDNVSNVSIEDIAYDSSSWNANMNGATKNVIRDEVEDLITSINTKAGKGANTDITSLANCTIDCGVWS